MNGWYFALVLYPIPILPQIVHRDSKKADLNYVLSSLLWPPLMIFRSIYYFILNRKKK